MPNDTTAEALREEARKADQLGWRSPRGSIIRTAYFDLAHELWAKAFDTENQPNAE